MNMDPPASTETAPPASYITHKVNKNIQIQKKYNKWRGTKTRTEWKRGRVNIIYSRDVVEELDIDGTKLANGCSRVSTKARDEDSWAFGAEAARELKVFERENTP